MIQSNFVLSYVYSVLRPASFALLSLVLSTGAQASNRPVFGVYAHEEKHWQPYVGAHFPLVVFRYYTGQPTEHQVTVIKKLSRTSNVIVNFEFMSGIRQRKSLDPLPPFEKIEPKLHSMLDGLKDIPIAAVSFDEENSLNMGKIRYLNALYKSAKGHSPNKRFVQWIVLPKRNGRVNFQGVDLLDTDGWIIDPYLSSGKDYEEMVSGLKETSKPIYSVVWAAPGWNVGAGYRVRANPSWWNDTGWKTFYNRVAVNKKNRIPTILYMYGLNKKKTINLWAGNNCDRGFFFDLINVTLPHLESATPSLKLPDSRPDWIPSYCD
ncbi:hypothetical protein [Altererythrobacter sp. C41]|uniref:hypothetical protein n=1 Tax=Altererythrobacter sp. C41 TaxID=2806021 RepID=UPI0019348F63|nr:hypothetical protein [Altererythrobacter sp. C41]MBM0171377.1 hypothetical protein [Altererythrobacter sp. C41]